MISSIKQEQQTPIISSEEASSPTHVQPITASTSSSSLRGSLINASTTTNNSSLITSVESIEDVSTSRLMTTSQIPQLLLQSSSVSDHHSTCATDEQDEEPFEISVIGNSGVVAIVLKDKHEYIHSDIIPSLTKTLNKLFRLAKTKPQTHTKYSRLHELWDEFREWFGTTAWDVFLFRLFDCLIVMTVLFCMRKILPPSVSRLLEWFIDPVDEAFPYSQQEQ